MTQVMTKTPTDDRRRPKRLVAIWRQSAQPSANYVSYTFRDDLRPRLIFHDSMRADQARYLADEQGIAFGTPMYHLCDYARNRYSSTSLDEFAHLLLREAGNMNPPVVRLPNEAAYCLRQLMGPRHLHVSVGSDNQEAAGSHLSRQELQ